MSYRYYLTQRPPMPGAFPNKEGNRAERIHENEKREAQVVYKPTVILTYGYVEYPKVLSSEDVKAYELTPGKTECNGCKYLDVDEGDYAPCRKCSRYPQHALSDFYEEN